MLKFLLMGLKAIIDIGLAPDLLLLGGGGPRYPWFLVKQNAL